jgi:hypothetical protein
LTPHSVYWIHHPDHTDMFSQGYIGVSVEFKRRMKDHFHAKRNRHLRFAINKYGWQNLIKKQILIAEKDYCLDIERKLRPSDDIGWNITAGGGNAPLMFGNTWNKGRSTWNKGKPPTQEVRDKISQTLMGHTPWNKGKTGTQTAWNKGVPMAYRDNAQFNQVHVCPHCQKTGKGNSMFRFHMDRCKFKDETQ